MGRPFDGSAPFVFHVKHRPLGDEVLEVADDRGLRLGADDGLGDLATLVHVQGRDGHDAVLGGRTRVLVDVELDDLDLVAVLGGDRLEGRRDLAARTAPGGPEVHQDGLVALEDVLLEGVVGHVLQGAGHGGLLSWLVRWGGTGRSDGGLLGLGLLLVREGGEEALGVESGGAAGAGRGDGLAVGVVDDVTGAEDTGQVGPGRGRLDLQVALVVQVELALEELRARVVADRDEQAGDRQVGESRRS